MLGIHGAIHTLVEGGKELSVLEVDPLHRVGHQLEHFVAAELHQQLEEAVVELLNAVGGVRAFQRIEHLLQSLQPRRRGVVGSPRRGPRQELGAQIEQIAQEPRIEPSARRDQEGQ